MTDKNQERNSDKSQKPMSVRTLTVSIFILIAALGIGMVIREFRTAPDKKEPVAKVNEETQKDTSAEQQTPEIIYTIPQNIEQPDPVKEVAVEPEPEPEPEPVYQEPVQNEQIDARNEQRRQDSAQWMSWFGGLSQEDQMQLFRGSIITYMQLMQRWQNLPQEQVQQEQAVLRELIEGWQNLPAQDRQQGIQNIQYQLEQWLQYNQQY